MMIMTRIINSRPPPPATPAITVLVLNDNPSTMLSNYSGNVDTIIIDMYIICFSNVYLLNDGRTAECCPNLVCNRKGPVKSNYHKGRGALSNYTILEILKLHP